MLRSKKKTKQEATCSEVAITKKKQKKSSNSSNQTQHTCVLKVMYDHQLYLMCFWLSDTFVLR